MQYYFFHSPNKEKADAFKQYAVKQNAAIANIVSITIIGLCIFLLLFRMLFETKVVLNEIADYKYVTLFLLSGSFFYRLGFILAKNKLSKRRINAYWLLSSFYALVITVGFMWLTFMAQHNPKNTLTMFMAGMFLVAMLWILDLRGTISVMLITLALFGISLHNFQTDYSILFQNYVVAIVISVSFFIISRILYSYHFRYYSQLKMIGDKNNEIKRLYQKHTNALDAVAHDLRSPLSSISALIEIARFPGVTEQEKEEYYAMILSACENADHILHDVIDAAKKSENSILEKATMSLNTFLESIEKKWIPRMTGGRKINFEKPEQDVIASINEQKMQRVMDNLINNSVKFTNNDGVINIGLTCHNNVVRIYVRDNGIGIPQNLKPYIFDRFTQAGRKGLYGEKSYGLGLNISQQIVEAHNGIISVQSKENEGTVFYIDLPLEEPIKDV